MRNSLSMILSFNVLPQNLMKSPSLLTLLANIHLRMQQTSLHIKYLFHSLADGALNLEGHYIITLLILMLHHSLTNIPVLSTLPPIKENANCALNRDILRGIVIPFATSEHTAPHCSICLIQLLLHKLTTPILYLIHHHKLNPWVLLGLLTLVHHIMSLMIFII